VGSFHISPYPLEVQSSSPRIVALSSASAQEIALVAQRMRETLVEVLGEARGTSMYTMEWLEERVRFHLGCEDRAVFLAEDSDGHVTGHTIVRIDRDEAGGAIGLFSTTYVEPRSRRMGIAKALLARGEAWMVDRGMTIAVTYTADSNAKLIAHYLGQGYALRRTTSEMVALSRPLTRHSCTNTTLP
jgi:GNAT superfamily N-acetyltransferase